MKFFSFLKKEPQPLTALSMMKALEKKPMYNYKMLQPFKIVDIDLVLKSEKEYGPCRLIAENDEFWFYEFKPKLLEYGSAEYTLRRSKNNTTELVFFGQSSNRELHYIYHNYLFQTFRKIRSKGSLIIKNIETGKIIEPDCFRESKSTRGHFGKSDYVNEMYIKDDRLILCVGRYNGDFHNIDASYNGETDYCLVFNETDGELTWKKVFVGDDEFDYYFHTDEFTQSSIKNDQCSFEESQSVVNENEIKLGRDTKKMYYCGCDESIYQCFRDCDKCAINFKDLGDENYTDGNFEMALNLYKKALFLENKYADAWLCLGKVYEQKGEYKKALDAFERAIVIDTTYGEAIFNKAMVLKKLERLDEAMDIVNDLLVLYNSPEVIAFKQQLVDLGAKDVYQLDTAIEIMTNKALKIASQNNLLDKDGKVRTERAIYKKTEFSSQIFDYCKRKHSLLGEEKVRSESIITAFYASLCTTLFYYKDKDGFENIHPFEYIKDHIDLEKADATAERMLEMKSGDAEAESLWNMIYDYAQFSGNIISKVEADDIEAAIIDATESAYVLGMLYAMRYFKKNNSTGRETIDAALAKLAESSKAYENPPPETAMCYSIRTPNEVDIKFTCDKCGKVTTLKVYEGHEGLIGDYQNLTAEFIKLGHNAEFLTLCDECAEQHFPSLSSWKKNNFVFIFTAEGSADSVCSFPSTWRYGDFEYRIALSFLNGADTIEKLAVITETRLNADVYLKHVESVIGSTKNKG